MAKPIQCCKVKKKKEKRKKKNRKRNVWEVFVYQCANGLSFEVAQSCLTLCNPMDCSLPCFSVHGIFQARLLEWVAISFSKGSSQPRDWTGVSLHCRQTLYPALGHVKCKINLKKNLSKLSKEQVRFGHKCLAFISEWLKSTDLGNSLKNSF